MSIPLPLQSGRFLVEIGSAVVANFQECAGLALENVALSSHRITADDGIPR